MDALGPSASALELAGALRRQELSAVELLDSCLEAVDQLNPELNAIIWRNDEQARRAAQDADRCLRALAGDGAGEHEHMPFLGVPIPIKDLTPVAGWPTTYGSHGAGTSPSDESELVVDAFVRAGFVLCARTNTPEFGVLTVTENSRYGVTHNPWDLSRSPGGSSGGAAAAVAAGMFALAHANDGGGSIRIPASYCGLVGLKPSRGRVPRLAQSWLGAVVEGALTRTVADSAAVLDAISEPDPLAWYNAPAPERAFADETERQPDPLRIGLMAAAPLGIPTAPVCTAAAQAAGAMLEQLGHVVEPVEVPTVSEEMIPPFVLLTQAGLGEYDDVDFSAVEPHVAYQHKLSGEVGAREYVQAGRTLELMSRRELARWGRDFDVLLTPTSGIEPPPAGSILAAQHGAPDQPVADVISSVSFTAFSNITGQPAISLPLHFTETGLPIGVMLTGGPWQEATLIRLAARLEEAYPWCERRPSLAGAA
ncbi:MAG TPA: amidase [Solirubrobacteraceae bacterium]|nr:amidase [Solirubrobacteraceae bacterium]